MPTTVISIEALEDYRARSFHVREDLRIGTEEAALDFVRELGFALLWTSGEQLNLPSLSAAYVKGNTWGSWWDWKQVLPAKKACFYSKILRHKGTFISWEYLPCFYAVYSPQRSYEEEWQDGVLDRSHKRILDALATQGPMMTKDVRLAFGPPSKKNTQLVRKALDELQRSFRVCAAGGDTEGWSHHLWDLVDRWVPKQHIRRGRSMPFEDAGAAITARYLRTVGAAGTGEIGWLFGWSREVVQTFLSGVKGLTEVELEGMPGRFFMLKPVLKELLL